MGPCPFLHTPMVLHTSLGTQVELAGFLLGQISLISFLVPLYISSLKLSLYGHWGTPNMGILSSSCPPRPRLHCGSCHCLCTSHAPSPLSSYLLVANNALPVFPAEKNFKQILGISLWAVKLEVGSFLNPQRTGHPLSAYCIPPPTSLSGAQVGCVSPCWHAGVAAHSPFPLHGVGGQPPCTWPGCHEVWNVRKTDSLWKHHLREGREEIVMFVLWMRKLRSPKSTRLPRIRGKAQMPCLSFEKGAGL